MQEFPGPDHLLVGERPRLLLEEIQFLSQAPAPLGPLGEVGGDVVGMRLHALQQFCRQRDRDLLRPRHAPTIPWRYRVGAIAGVSPTTRFRRR